MTAKVAEKLDGGDIRRFWTEQARRFGRSPQVSWSDIPVIDLELREILKHVADGDRVLDAGCASGFTTVRLAEKRDIRIRGVDYIPEMIDEAHLRLAAEPASLVNRVEFGVGDITALREPTASFDKVVVIRVLINLGEWSVQLKALRECGRVIRRGGLLLLSEATLGGWGNLNRFRREWGLPDIGMPAFNNYLDEDLLLTAAASEWDVLEVSNFASTYYVGTRVLKPLLARVTAPGMDVGDPGMEWNRWCAQLPAFGDYGTQKLFVLRRR